MKKFLPLLALLAGLSATVASAVPVNITVDSTGALYNTIGVVSKDASGQANNNPDSNLTFLQKEIGYWNNAFDPDLPAAVGPVALNLDDLKSASSYTSVAGYDYVVFHFGAGAATPKSTGGWYQVFFLDGHGGDIFNLPQVGGKNVGGFSSARYYNAHVTHQVPDGGSTGVLVGFGVLGLAVILRKRLA